MSGHPVWNGMPSEIRLNICWHLDIETLANLARVDKNTQTTAEEVLYRKDTLRPKASPLSGFWAAKNNLLGTLNKLIVFNENRTDVDISALVDARSVIPHPFKDLASDDDFLGPPKLWNRNLPCFRFQTALHFAAEGGYDTIVARLLETGANINALASGQGFTLLCDIPVFGITPLYYALVNGHASTALLLLEKGASHDIAIPRHGIAVFTALHFAVFAGLTTVVDELLITYDTNVNHAIVDGVTPIHMAVLGPGNISCLQKLVDAGALVSSEFRLGVKLPLPYLPESARATIFNLILALEDEEMSLKAFNILRAAGLTLATEDYLQKSPVQRAIDALKPCIAKQLLEQGFQAFHRIFSAGNCLFMLSHAINYGYTYQKYPKSPGCTLQCAKLLVNAGAEVSIAAVRAFLDIGEFQVANFLFPYMNDPPSSGADYWVDILEPKIDVFIPHNVGILEFLIRNCPPSSEKKLCPEWRDLIRDLFHSSFAVIDSVIGFLMEHAEEGLIQHVNGCNGLMALLRNPSYSHALHRDLITRLLNCGAKPDDRDHYGNTYIHHLLANEGIGEDDFNSAVALLLNLGVDLNAHNLDGQTALHIVAKRLNDSYRYYQPMPLKYGQLTSGLNKINTLLDCGALRNWRDGVNMTPHDVLKVTWNQPETSIISPSLGEPVYASPGTAPVYRPTKKWELNALVRSYGYIKDYTQLKEVCYGDPNKITDDPDIHVAESEALFNAALEKLALRESEKKNEGA